MVNTTEESSREKRRYAISMARTSHCCPLPDAAAWIGGETAPPNCNDFKRTEEEKYIQVEAVNF